MMKNFIITVILMASATCFGQTKYFNTFTLIDNGKGKDVRDNIKLEIYSNSLSMTCKTFNFKNAQKTGKNELYNDSKKGDMIATQYRTHYYEIILMRYVETPNEIYLKIVDINEHQEYLIHLHNT